MTPSFRLTPEERAFFALVNRAVTANPFSQEREKLDREISGLMDGSRLENHIEAAIAEVTERLTVMRDGGRLDVRRYPEADARILERAVAFDIFHRMAGSIDRFIQDQIAAGSQPIKAAFAADMLRQMHSAGIAAPAALQYLEYSFQFRRAYYFIFEHLVGRSQSMGRLRERLWNNVFTHDVTIYDRHLRNRMEDFSTLILGATGTGKGTVAGAIGRSGFIPFDESAGAFVESFARSFVELNLSQYPEALIESELFGHRKGAFTGAMHDHEGVFSRCSRHGAIFLDEIGEVSQPVQIKLLKVLEERQYTPVGSHETRRFQGRVIAATNRSLEEIAMRKVLREDFLYRLCSDVITMPPLHERIREDPLELDDLLAHTVARIIGAPSASLAALCREVIDRELGGDYPWPGNVRELGQCVRQILLNGAYHSIHRQAAAGTAAKDAAELDAQELLQRHCHALYAEYGTYGEVARRTKLDRRTVKKYVDQWRHKTAEETI